MQCPSCRSSDVEKVKEWIMPKKRYHVAHCVCRNCGYRFNHYAGRGKEFVLRMGASTRRRRRAAVRSTHRHCDAVSVKIKIPIPKIPPNIVAVDQFGDAFYVHDTEKSTEDPTAAEALQEAVRRAADRLAEAVVYFGEDKKLQEAKLPPWINRNAIISLAKELEKYVEKPFALSAARREVFGKTDLLELELAAIQNFPGTKTSEEYQKLLRIRFETIAWLYGLYKIIAECPSLSTC